MTFELPNLNLRFFNYELNWKWFGGNIHFKSLLKFVLVGFIWMIFASSSVIMFPEQVNFNYSGFFSYGIIYIILMILILDIRWKKRNEKETGQEAT